MFLIKAIQMFILGSLFSLKKIIQRFTDVSFPMLVNGKKSFRAQRLIRKCITQRIFSSESGALPGGLGLRLSGSPGILTDHRAT